MKVPEANRKLVSEKFKYSACVRQRTERGSEARFNGCDWFSESTAFDV